MSDELIHSKFVIIDKSVVDLSFVNLHRYDVLIVLLMNTFYLDQYLIDIYY